MSPADQTTPERRRRRATRLDVAAALLTAGVALAGCYGPREPIATPAPIDYRHRHPIALHEGDRALELFIGNARGGLTPGQRADVLAFAKTWNREATGGVVIELPAGTPNERAAADSLPEIQSILAAVGIPPTGMAVQSYHPDQPGKIATLRIRFPKLTASAGPCGLWPDDIGPNVANPGYVTNQPYWNFGCASQRNLAAMVDNPSDLVQPRGETPIYAARRSTAIEKYRKGDSPNGKYEIDEKGKISEVGQ